MSIIDSSGDTLNDKEYYGLCGKKIDYCQYDNCFNKTRTSDSDFWALLNPKSIAVRILQEVCYTI